LLLAATTAFADEAQIRKVVEAEARRRRQGGGIEPVRWALRGCAFRSSAGMRILYTDANATHLFLGKIYDTKSDAS